MTPRTRIPTGIPNWPMILLEGPDSVGKSFQAAQFTGCERTGQAYWLDMGEGAGDEYINVPGADYLILDHDGSWVDIITQIQEAVNEPTVEGKPSVLVVDSMSNVWDMLKAWVNARARGSKKNRQILAADPDAEIKPAPNLWNDANDRHHQLLNLLSRFPGVVVLTAKGKETIAMDDAGRPIPGVKDYSVEANKNLPFRVNAHVRLSRDSAPMVVSFRSATNGLRPGVDNPQRYPDFTLEDLVFNTMGLGVAQTRAVTELVSDEQALANAARSDLGAFIRDQKIAWKPLAERFFREHEETLEDTRDAQAIRNLLDELKTDQLAAEAS